MPVFNQETTQALKKPWATMPHLFAERASKGRWVPYNYLRYISIRITQAIIRGGGRFIITIPPRHGKSVFISEYTPTWFLHNWAHKQVILASYAHSFASKWGGKVQAHLTSNPLVQIPMSSNYKAKDNFRTAAGGGMISAGIGGPITGEGAHLLLIDDPVKNWQEAMSPVLRERNKDWYRSVARTRLEPGATVIVLQTRWHEDDLSGWLLEENPGLWTLINFPAVCETEGDLLGRNIGDALCPTRYDVADLESIRHDLGELVWAALFQQRPTSLHGNIVLKEWLRFYDEAPTIFDEEIIVADLTYKESPTADFSVIEAWGRKGTSIYLLDQIRARMGFPDQIKAIKTMSKRHPNAYRKLIEEAANGAAVIEVLRNEILGLVPVRPMTSKEARLAAVSPLYQSGNVYYPNPMLNHWVEVNIGEILTMPNGKFDDTVDTASMAVGQLGKVSNAINRLEALTRR